jgi:hypothetical protein
MKKSNTNSNTNPVPVILLPPMQEDVAALHAWSAQHATNELAKMLKHKETFKLFFSFMCKTPNLELEDAVEAVPSLAAQEAADIVLPRGEIRWRFTQLYRLIKTQAFARRHANPDAVDAGGFTRLSYSAALGDFCSVHFLLSNGADPRHKDRHGHTAHDYMCRSCDKNCRSFCMHCAHEPVKDLLRAWMHTPGAVTPRSRQEPPQTRARAART